MARYPFPVHLVAGCTVIEPGRNEHPIHRPNGMDGWICNLTVVGRGRINSGSERFACEPGDLLLFPAAVPHDYAADPALRRWTHLWVYFFPRSAWYEWLNWPEAAGGVLRIRLGDHELRPRIERCFEELVASARSGMRRAEALAMALCEQLLLLCDAANPSGDAARFDPRVQAALDYLHVHSCERLSVGRLARAAGMSPSRLAHLFTAQVGEPPMRYLERWRILQAGERLLTTALPVQQIARQVGFQDPRWFGRVFRRLHGCSPREFRQGRHRAR